MDADDGHFRPNSAFHRLMGTSSYSSEPLSPFANEFIYDDDKVVLCVNQTAADSSDESVERFHQRRNAVRSIWRAYTSYRNRRLFRELKFVVERTEKALTPDLLRRLSPKEAELLLDPVLKVVVRFRFGGESFPPSIFYKVHASAGSTVTINGVNAILPGSTAAFDACRQMGNRRYIENMLCVEQTKSLFSVSEVYEIGSKADSAKFQRYKNEIPVSLGGRGNGWRSLNDLPLLSQQSLWRVIVQRAYANHQSSEKLVRRLYRYVRTQKNMFSDHMKSTLPPPREHAPTPSSLKLKKWQKLFREQKGDVSCQPIESLGIDLAADTEFYSLFTWANNLSEDSLHSYNDLLNA